MLRSDLNFPHPAMSALSRHATPLNFTVPHRPPHSRTDGVRNFKLRAVVATINQKKVRPSKTGHFYNESATRTCHSAICASTAASVSRPTSSELTTAQELVSWLKESGFPDQVG